MVTSGADLSWAPAQGNGAVLVERDGVPVVAHYGSVASEIAVCMKAAALVERANLRQLSIAGPEALLGHVLASAVPNAVPKPGHAVCLADTWCARVEAREALVAGAPSALARWRQVASRPIAAGGLAVSTESRDDAAALSVVGPRAARVMAAAGLPSELGPGEVSRGTLAGHELIVVRELADRFLLLLRRGCPPEVWRALSDAGRPFGLAPVGIEAVERLQVAASHPPLALH